MLLKVEYFQKKQGKGLKSILYKQLKALAPKQMLQRLPKALAQVKAGNRLEKLFDEIRQIIYSSYQAKQITKKVHINIMTLMKLWNRMDTKFMYFENSKHLIFTNHYSIFQKK